jgi:hypothetical protein
MTAVVRNDLEVLKVDVLVMNDGSTALGTCPAEGVVALGF